MKRQTSRIIMVGAIMLALTHPMGTLAAEIPLTIKKQAAELLKEKSQQSHTNEQIQGKKAKSERPLLNQTAKEENQTQPEVRPAPHLPLAVAKENVKVELNTTITPEIFVTGSKGVKLRFKTRPNISQIGMKKAIILATRAQKTEEITVPFVVKDSQKPKITLLENDLLLNLDEVVSVNDLALVVDNSNDYDLFFIGGRKNLDTSKVGEFSTQIIARDKSGNEDSVTLRYEVIDDDPGYSDQFDYQAPQIDQKKSTNTVIYGKTEPNKLVGVFNKAGELLGEALANARGEFQLHLKEGVLFRYRVVYVQSFDLDGPELSDIAEYWYKKAPINRPMKQPSKTHLKTKEPLEKSPAKPPIKKIKKEQKKNPSETIDKLPQTGDNMPLGEMVLLGVLLIGILFLYLRKRV